MYKYIKLKKIFWLYLFSLIVRKISRSKSFRNKALSLHRDTIGKLILK